MQLAQIKFRAQKITHQEHYFGQSIQFIYSRLCTFRHCGEPGSWWHLDGKSSSISQGLGRGLMVEVHLLGKPCRTDASSERNLKNKQTNKKRTGLYNLCPIDHLSSSYFQVNSILTTATGGEHVIIYYSIFFVFS